MRTDEGIHTKWKPNTDHRPTSPKSRACHGTSGRTEHKLSETEERSQREIPSAATLNIPRTCFASKCHPEDSSRTPIRGMSAPDRGSLPPRHRRTHCTAASLSARSKTQSPVGDGRSAHEETGAHAELTMPKRSRTLIEIATIPVTDLLERQKRDCSSTQGRTASKSQSQDGKKR